MYMVILFAPNFFSLEIRLTKTQMYLYVQSKTSLQDISEQDLREIVTRNEEIYGTCEHQINEIVEGLKAIPATTFGANERVFSSVSEANAAIRSDLSAGDSVTIVVYPGVYDHQDLDNSELFIYGRGYSIIMANGVVCRNTPRAVCLNVA